MRSVQFYYRCSLLVLILILADLRVADAQTVGLAYPSHDIVTADTSIDFQWDAYQVAQYYIFNLSIAPSFSSTLVSDSTNDHHFLVDDLNSSAIYYWRVRCKTSSGYTAWSSTRKFTVFNPKDLATLHLWLSADTGVQVLGNAVTQWDDLSGNGYNATQSSSLNRPIYRAIDDSLYNASSLIFNGSSHFLNGVTIPTLNTSSMTLYMIISAYNVGNVNSGLFTVNDFGSGMWVLRRTYGSPAIFYSTNGNWFDSGANSLPQEGYNYRIISVNKNINTFLKLSVNGVLQNQSLSSSITGSFTNNNYVLGYANGFEYYNGRMAEVILSGESDNDSIQALMTKYLMDKYAPPVNLGPDRINEYSLCTNVLNAGEYFESCSWNTGSNDKSITIDTSGLYWVQATDIFGRISRDSVYIELLSTGISDFGLCITDTIEASPNLSHAYDFLWNDASTDSLLEISAAGTYWVEITDSTALHCSVRDSFVVVVDSFPITANLGADRSLCQGDVLELIDGELSAVDYLWSNGETTESIVVNTAGEYSLTVTNNNACLARDTLNIDIAGFRPLIGFDFNNVCSGSPVAFVDTSVILTPDGPATWLWIFGDGDSAQVQNPQHIFPSAGDFPVLFQLTTDSGCKADTLVSVHVYKNPSAYFTPVQGCSGQNILFFDESSSTEGFLNGYQWAFDDPASGTSNSSMIQNPYHAFTSAGDYNVQMIVQTNLGCYDTLNRSVHIKQSPEANFNFTTACEGNRVYFADITDVPVYEQIIKTIWHFGDGNTSSYASTSNLYDSAGMYDVTLIVQSLNGCYDTVVQTIAVHPVPVADFVWSNPCFNQSVEFVDNSTIAFDNIIGYNWTFAELGQASSNPSFMTFPGIGDYDIALTVTSDFGCTDSIHKIIKIYPIPTAIFMVDPEYGIPPLEVQLYNQSIGGNTYLWNFGDGGTAVTANPTHIYYGTDIYDIWLIVANEYGCTDSTSQVVYVIPGILDLRIDAFYVADSLGEYHMTVDMTNQGTRNIREIVLEADVSGNIPAREHWEGLLLPGQSLRYNFVSGFISEGASTHQYLCVNVAAENTAESDATPENNVECYSLSDDFNIIETYPNPANESTVVSFYLPEDGNVEYTLTSSEGKLIEAGSANELEAGVNRLVLATLHLAAGTYTLQLRYIDVEVSTIILIGH